jgi:phage tail-like protein
MSRTDPLRAYNFLLRVGNHTAHFTSCSQLGVDVEVIKYREAGLNEQVRWLPGRVEYSEVILRYGLTKDAFIWNWLESAVTGQIRRENVTITALDYEGQAGGVPTVSWVLEEAWPCRWRGALLDTLSREASIESVTLVFEKLRREPA